MPDPINPDQPTPITARMTGSGGLWQPPSVEEAAQLFPQYEVLALIGRGGMGAVYQARQIALDRFVAIKLLPLEVSADRDFADRFVREARTMGKLSHPNIIAVYDFGQTTEGHLYFAMEFVDGTNLHQIIHGAGLEPAQALAIIGEVCDALAYAHDRGVVHRDIKPANVMVNREGRVKVADFGLARLTDPSAENLGHTQTGIVMGTPDYMAPEQKRGMNVDHRADIYSLGVMLYEMLCKETPQGAFEPPSRRVPVDARVDEVVAKAMQQAPERRFESSTQMKAAVDIIRTMPPPRTRHSALPATSPSPDNNRTLFYAGIAAAIVAIIGVLIFVSRPKPKRAVARAPVATTPLATPKQTPLAEATPTPAPATPAPTPAPMPVAAATPAPTPAPPPPPEPEKPKAAPEVVKWLAEQEAAYTAQWKAEAVTPFDTAVARLRAQYAATIEKNLADATKAGKLEDAIAWKNEQARIAAQQPHEAEDAPTDPAALRQLRAWWRGQFARLDAERFAKARAVHQRFDTLLATGQGGYTQKQRFDDALLLKTKRDELAKLWLEPPLDISKHAGPKAAMGEKLAPPKPVNIGTGTLTGSEAIEWFLEMNGHVAFEDASGVQQNISAPNEPAFTVPKGKLEVVSVMFDRNKRDGSAITDADFEKVAPLRKLTSFVLTAPQVTGSGLSFLAGCRELTTVSLNLPSSTDAVLVPLLGLRKLTQLSLTSGTQPLTWTRLAELASLPTLESFSATGVDNLPAAALGRMKKLRTLSLQATRLGDEQFAAIGAMPDLDTLTLNGMDGTSAAGFRHLQTARKVVTLNITGCPGAEPHLGFIGKMRSLSTLYMDGQFATGLAAAAGAPALCTLYLAGPAGTTGTTDAGLKVIAENFPRLEWLAFMDATERTITVEGIRSLARMPKLKTFTWGKKPLPADIAAALAALPALEKLIVAESGIEDAQLIELAKSKTLMALDLSFQKLHPAALDVLKTMRGLRELFVYSCGLTPDELAALRKALPRCAVKDG